ncbi:MAG: hypothetical protein KatS3mg103_0985 [Phycisphaerales bacterium]|nr:MAG: hypothetical protein KatS3mg103_0985 [Phycisphaerales bacterium]
MPGGSTRGAKAPPADTPPGSASAPAGGDRLASRPSGWKRAAGQSASVGLVLLAALRSLMAYEPMPGWGLDPYTLPIPAGSFGPATSATLDAFTLLLAGAVFVAWPPARWRPWLCWAALLVAVGLVGLFHGVGDGLRPAELAPALAWTAALAGAGAIARAARDRSTAGLLLALLVGLSAVLVAKGLVQRLIEHPATVARFEADKARILAAQGLQEGTAAARAYERRLRQPGITAWLGFSNAVASLLACAGVAMAALALAARGIAARSLLALGAAAALGLVLIGWSKGAIASAGLGLLAVGIGWWRIRSATRSRRPGADSAAAGAASTGRPQHPRTSKAASGDATEPASGLGPGGPRPSGRSRWVGLAAVAGALAVVLGPLLAVVVRGLVGPGLAERSLLFRWYYLEGALRIALEHPWLGVGPGGFKDAYALAKNPLSPENAASPHSVVFDAAACLGLPVGLGVLALVLWAAWRASAAVLEPWVQEPAVACGGRRPARAAAGSRAVRIAGPAAVVLVAMAAEMASLGGLGPWLALPWIAGLVGWVALAVSARRVGGAGVRLAAASGALVLLAHGQIEMTPVLVGSASLWSAWVALGVAGACSPETVPGLLGKGVSAGRSPGRSGSGRPWLGWVLGGTAWVLAAAAVGAAVAPLWAWQGAVVEAAGHAGVPARWGQRLQAGRADPRLRPAILEELAEALGVQPDGPPVSQGLGPAMDRLRELAFERAAGAMDRAVRAAPGDGPTLRAASRAWLMVALLGGPGADRAAERAEALARRAVASRPESGQNLSHLASVLLEFDERGRLDEALEAAAGAAALNPGSPQAWYRVYELARRAERLELARRSARAALQADERTALDPLGAGLGEGQRAELEEFLAGPG